MNETDRESSRLRLVFMGTPDFAVPALLALGEAGHEIACVYAQPPRPAGRGQRLQPSPVQAVAEARGWPVRTPSSLRSPQAQADFAALDADAAVVAAYGLILPQAVLDSPRLGCLNIHASLLPRWRGAAPIQRAILAGDRETGICVMQMEAGLDTGPVLLERSLVIGDRETAQGLHDRLASLGAGLIVEALAGWGAGRLEPQLQASDGVTYAAKLEKAEARLDWRRTAVELERQVRAFTPWPGAFFETANGTRIKVLAAELVAEGRGHPGEVIDDALTVACATGALRPVSLQRPGKAPAETAAFLRGFPLPAGSRLPPPG
ncbi:methionyl-tRNA formyltransferase [Algihabitans albus]|uniref:methionyl-tRNA formyltransferase n=1 Tax=Algihabitans albus TaxID=2164067 RepID=UPI001ABC13C8|nr:methionyl-tRNA formyltransferase [Algihabitans albus]